MISLLGATSIRRLLRRSAMTIGYGSGPSHAATGRLRDPVKSGIAGSLTPLETDPEPRISGVTLTEVPPKGPAPAAQTAAEVKQTAAPNISCRTARRGAIAARGAHSRRLASID